MSPSGQILNLIAAPQPGAERIDRVLAQAFPEISRTRFARLIADGQVRVEGQVAGGLSLKLKGGEAIEIHVPAPEAAAPQGEAMALDIVYEDPHLIVIDKPAGLVVHPAAGHQTGTLVNALIAHCGESLSGIGGVRRPGIVHRLDKDTSGLLVVAKTDAAHAGLSAQFAAHGRDGRLERSYTAVVWGTLERSAGVIRANLARSMVNRQKIAVSQADDARESITHYETVAAFGPATQIICRLETGRTHQIRVHMAHIGHPLLGDDTYARGFLSSVRNLASPVQAALAKLARQALHAETLGFVHPVTGKPMHFESPLPPDLATLIAALNAAAAKARRSR